MTLFRRNPHSQVQKALSIMGAEMKANDKDGRGLMNRPRYVTAQQTIRKLGQEATQPLLRSLERLRMAEDGSPAKWLANDVIELLGDTRDESAVPKIAPLLSGIWPSLPRALAKTEAGTQILLEAARSPNSHLRAQAMEVWASRYRPAEIVEVLVAGLRDTHQYVRHEAVSSIMAREQAEQPIINALLDVRSSDPVEKLRDRADSALRKVGVI